LTWSGDQDKTRSTTW